MRAREALALTMGYLSIEAKIVGRLHAHNDPRDDTDRAIWNELMDRIDLILREPIYARVVAARSLPREEVTGYGWRSEESRI